MKPFWLQLLKEAQQPQFNFPGFPAATPPIQQPVQQAQSNAQQSQVQAAQPNQPGSPDSSVDVHRFHQELESLPSSFLGDFVQPYSIPRDKISIVTKNLMALYEARRWYYDYIHWYIRYQDALEKAQRPLDAAGIIAQVRADIDELEARRKAIEMKMNDEKKSMDSIPGRIQTLLSALGSSANKVSQESIDKTVSSFIERLAQQHVWSLMSLEAEINEINRQIAEKTTHLSDIQNQRPNSAFVAKYQAEQQAHQKAAVEAYSHLEKAYNNLQGYLKNYPVIGEIIGLERSIAGMFRSDDNYKTIIGPDQTTLKLMMYRYYLMLRNTVYSGVPLESLDVGKVISTVDQGAPEPGQTEQAPKIRPGQPTTGGVGASGGDAAGASGALQPPHHGPTTRIGPGAPQPAAQFAAKPPMGPMVFGRKQPPAGPTPTQPPSPFKPPEGLASAKPLIPLFAPISAQPNTPGSLLKNLLAQSPVSPSPTFLSQGTDLRDLLQLPKGQGSRPIAAAVTGAKNRSSVLPPTPGPSFNLV